MKTKRLILTLAAMLLMSLGAFAQSNNPLKGDVNGDDVVDIGDVVAVLGIMKEGEGIGERQYYFSIGTTPVTASNFKIANNPTQVTTSSYENQYEYTPSEEEAFVYVLVADKWWVASFVDQTTGEPINYSEVSDGSISGYNVYKTNIEISEGILVNIEPIFYYWYIGQTNPSTMTSISPIVTDTSSPGWRLIGTTLPTYSSSNKLFEYVEGGEIVTGPSLAKQYIAIPAESSACPRDGAGNDASTVDIYTRLSDVTISGVSYKVYETVGKSRKLAIDIY